MITQMNNKLFLIPPRLKHSTDYIKATKLINISSTSETN